MPRGRLQFATGLTFRKVSAARIYFVSAGSFGFLLELFELAARPLAGLDAVEVRFALVVLRIDVHRDHLLDLGRYLLDVF